MTELKQKVKTLEEEVKTLEKEKEELTKKKDEESYLKWELELELLDMENNQQKQQQEQEEKQKLEQENKISFIDKIKKIFKCPKRKNNNTEKNQNIKNKIDNIQKKINKIEIDIDNIEKKMTDIQNNIKNKNNKIEITKKKIINIKILDNLKKTCFYKTSDPYRKKAIMNANSLKALRYAVEAKGFWGGTSRTAKIAQDFIQKHQNDIYNEYMKYDLESENSKHILNMYRCVSGEANETPYIRPRT